jgi:hypothetical protein
MSDGKLMTETEYEEWSKDNRRYGFDNVVITPDRLAELMKGKLILVDVHQEFQVIVRFALSEDEPNEQ